MANIQLYLILLTALNIFLSSNAKYVGLPRNAKALRVAVTKTITLKCLYNVTDGDGQFLGWSNDNGTIQYDKKSEHYVVKNTPKDSTLVITFTKEDHKMKKWYVKTSKLNQEEPIECQFGQIALKPIPERIETNRKTENLTADGTSVRRLQTESVSFKCIIEPNVTSPTGKILTKWEFSEDGEKFSKELPSEVQNKNENEIFIDRINKIHRGYYRCARNNVTFSALLRVKDPFAALYPFIGIVGTVLVLVIVILIYEKRQKSARKAAAVEDEVNDNANDPLVQSPNKLSDDENKKRTVKA